jgi:uncharacterized protein
MNRREFLFAAAALTAYGVGYAGVKLWPEKGFTNLCLSGIPKDLAAHPLMQRIWEGIDASQVWDCHAHLVGMGDNSSNIWVNPRMDSWLHPILKVQKYFYINGACADEANVDISTIKRMTDLAIEMPIGYKTMLLAFDWCHDEAGKPLKDNSTFYIPNSYAAKVASEHSQYFEWVASIHPYRADAVDALEQVKAQGARAIKWLPSGMGIDPASPKCDAFYKKAAELNIPIITHSGRESAVLGGDQKHGNPLRMRRALDAGVRVALAHCASDGHDEDLDNKNKRVKSIDLFTRLMDTPEYQTLVFGEISALTLINHAWAIKPILTRTDWHARLLNGSDYPLPGIFPLINTEQLARLGLLDVDRISFLQRLKQYNSLMFDFAVKRLIEFDGVKFSANIFETRKFFDASI